MILDRPPTPSPPLHITTPLTAESVASLRAGDLVLITGIVYGARDAAHQRMVETVQSGQALPVDLNNQMIYYVGPAPAKAGHVIGPAGPTTSGRMDPYTLAMLAQGVKGFVGKGYRSVPVKAAMMEHGAVDLAAVGGAAALLARQIRSNRVVAYPDLGPEALFELLLDEFPAIVINDIHGGDAYQRGHPPFPDLPEHP